MFALRVNCLLSLLFISFSAINRSSAAKCSTAYDFDYLLLATQWPESFCETQKCAAHEDVWSIHGGWPNYNNGKWPQDCCYEKEFRIDELKSIRTELDKKWKTLTVGKSDAFWTHEWQKHGTCAMNSPLLKGELNYFKNILAAFDTLSIDKWLTDANITPSKSKAYTATELHSALSKSFGYKVQVECLKKLHNSSQILSQINFCLNKETLKPFDCPTKSSNECTKTIAYLPSK